MKDNSQFQLPDQQFPLKLQLSLSEVNEILDALGDAITAHIPLIEKIQTQAQEQLSELAEMFREFNG